MSASTGFLEGFTRQLSPGKPGFVDEWPGTDVASSQTARAPSAARIRASVPDPAPFQPG
jgi:hypothetical protein